MYRLQYTGITDVGKKRSGNEDRYYVDWCWDDQHLLVLCVDGCGGYSGGEIAAQLTINNVCTYLEKHREGALDELLKQALVYANNIIHEARNDEPSLNRMCCVTTAALIDLQAQDINMVHVGDTRLYAVSQGRIIKLSHDHSPVGRDEEAGLLTETEAMASPSRNIIERAIGEKNLDVSTSYIDTAIFPMAKGITWLFCTDGLCDMITSAEMADILGQNLSLEEKAKKLVKAANEAGGKDNITVILVHAEGEEDKETQSVMNRYATSINPNSETDYSELMKQMFGSSEEDIEETNDSEEKEGDTTETEILQPIDVPWEPVEEQAGEEQAAQPDSSDRVEEHSKPTEETIEQPTEITPPPSHNEMEEETTDISVPDISKQPHATLPKRYIYILAVVLLILIPVGTILYLHYKEVKEQEQWQRDEVIRQEILRRELYYNINDRIDLMNNDSIQIH